MPRLIKILLVLVSAAAILLLSMLAGAWIGGNYAQNFQFNGVRGYEATAQIGLLCGSLALVLFGIYFWMKRK